MALTEFSPKFEQEWSRIKESAIVKLQDYFLTGNQQQMFSKKEYMENYTQENIQSTLYDRYGTSIESFLKEKVFPSIKNDRGEALLKSIEQTWQQHVLMVRWMQRFFQYLDRFHVKINSLESLTEKGYKIYKNVIFNPLKQYLNEAVLHQIEEERSQNMIETHLLKNVVEVYVTLSSDERSKSTEDFTCLQELQEKIYNQAQAFYQARSRALLAEESFGGYMNSAKEYLDAENRRCEQYLGESFREQLVEVFREQVLILPMNQLLQKETGLPYLFKNHLKDDLKLTFNLYKSKEKQLQLIAAAFTTYIHSLGMNLITQIEAQQIEQTNHLSQTIIQETRVIENLIKILDEAQQLCTECFDKATQFERAKANAFEEFMNKQVKGLSFAELLGTYTDKLLRKGGYKTIEEVSNHDQMSEYLEKLVHLFTHLTDKDVFIDVYRNLLAKRLLNDKCESNDTEKDLLTKIKITCGVNVTKKCEGMLNDLNTAQNEMRKFNETDESQGLPLEFKVQVLTSAFWPSYKKYEVQIPPQISSCIDIFENFYKAQATSMHKQLTWCYANGNAELRGNFAEGKQFDFVVSSLQMCILLLFNQKEQLSFREIKGAMKFEDDVCKKNIFSLMMKNSRVLKKLSNTESKSIQDEDTFEVNDDFSSQFRKVTVPVPIVETVYAKNRVEQDRSHAIEAAIVRIMKNRKQLEHEKLLEEVRAQLINFLPALSQIQSKIENMIEREYLARDEKDNQVYKYLA